MSNKNASVFTQNLATVQSYFNDNCKGGTGLRSKDVHAAMAGTPLGAMKEEDFQVQLSLAVKSGKIVGFTGKKGRTGGYYPHDQVPANKPKPEPKAKVEAVVEAAETEVLAEEAAPAVETATAEVVEVPGSVAGLSAE